MPYQPKYRIAFTNELQEEIVVQLQHKDGWDGDIIDYAAMSCKISYQGEESKYTPILGCSLDVEFDIRPEDVDYWPDFADAEKDTWLVIVTNDGQFVFHGFVLPDEGVVPFQDRPYKAKITAVDGLGLLRDIPLVQPNGAEFRGEDYIIWYLAAALQLTGLVLSIRVYDDVYHSSMIGREEDISADFFGQAKLDYRTFQKSATEFVSAHEALTIILKEGYRAFYWQGEWTIIRLGLYQYVPYQLFYTLYDYNGANPIGGEVMENYATVGKNELKFPHSENQDLSRKLAVRSTRTEFKYDIWPEIPKNSKFERGDIQSTGTAYDETDVDGDEDRTEVIGRFENYSIPDWENGLVDILNDAPGFTISSNGVPPAVVKRVYNVYDLEIYREVVIHGAANATTGEVWLRSEAIPVIEGDRIKLSFDKRSGVDWGGSTFDRAAIVYVVSPTGHWYYLHGLLPSSDGYGKWLNYGYMGFSLGGRLNGFIYAHYGDSDKRQYTSVNIESDPIPISGNMYVALINNKISFYQCFRNINLEYMPFASGGYVPVKGDYWQTNQSKNYPDKTEEEIFISDNEHKVFKGCLLDSNGVPFTADWHRHGLSESKHYKQICNLQRFNHEYRRFWFIEGSFKGLKFAPSNDQENHQPLGFHKTYRFVDIAGDDKRFILCAPLEMDLIKGWITARFHEVSEEPKVAAQPETVGALTSRIIAAINATTESQWNSEGVAPAPGTPGFKPVAAEDPALSNPARFAVQMNQGDTMVCLAVGATVAKQESVNAGAGTRLILFTIQEYQAGAQLTFQAYLHDIIITVQVVDTLQPPDGQKTGTQQFKYIF